MRTLAAILSGAVLLLPLTALATEIPGGPVYGHWYSSGNPYNINGHITVPADSTLYIHEAVEVIFQGNYYLHVNGFLEAVGTEADSILFTGSSWGGISFENAPDSSHLAYCIVQNVDDFWGPTLLGAVTCRYSNPVITHCRISDNVTTYYGFTNAGGIALDNSNAEISWCNISNNEVVAYGGGINCMYNSSPVIHNCEIRDNQTDTGWGAQGGGIHIGGNCHPIIMNCTIEGNTSYDGGGIASGNGRMTLTECTIAENLADGGAGGGIWISGGDVFITGSTIDRNGVYASPTNEGPGGGIYADCDTLLVDHCTFFDNYPGDWTTNIGWAIHSEGSTSMTLTNSIVRGRSGMDRLIGHWGASASISYSDFYKYRFAFMGNLPPGLGELTQVNANGDSCDVYFNIFLDPVFVGLYNQDYNLRWRSPCIDAGDPNSPLDPDNTVCDMGRFYFDQDVMGVVELYPHDEPIVIPPGGGQLVYDGWVFNFFGHPGRADIWTMAFVPGMGPYGPIDLYRNVRIPADSIGMNEVSQNVPGVAPAGDYVFVGYVGSYPSTIIDSSYFYFIKSGSVGGGIADWFDGGEWLRETDLPQAGLPIEYVLSQNYPNPFNAETRIHYQLPLSNHVKLEVYNILGEKIGVLVDEMQETGYKSVTWDASEVSSGVYFYKLSAGDFTESRRMMLVK